MNEQLDMYISVEDFRKARRDYFWIGVLSGIAGTYFFSAIVLYYAQ